MRAVVKFCAGLFVLLGFLVFMGGLLFTMSAFSDGPPSAVDAIPLLGSVLAGASIVLIGGGTYVLCSVDERLELMARKFGAAGADADVAAGQF